uniref:NADH-ubiquinone oxidoreductase chain 6 n=1 Tax=Trigoniophthalmus alternatus TaxID=50637 RepID=B2BSA9_9INSE|nr:NADH dehydrogenase subunit 6 [Trigoniophthalmus alternatus]ABS57562.1 NADH dehydrogenase subunit 6 [Trigoniophthalmus alternatus]
MFMTISTMILFINYIFMYSKHPILMGLTLMIQTLLISLLMGTIFSSYWFSYVLFLIFLGGLLVLFIYIASLASNDMFPTSMKSFMMTIIVLSTIIMMATLVDKLLIINKITNNQKINLIKSTIDISVSKFYIMSMSPMTVTLITYLFLTLIIAVKITKIYKGPLRNLF